MPNLAEDTVRGQLGRIPASEIFIRSERLSAFLRFIVEAALRGGPGSLKVAVIAWWLSRGPLHARPPFNTAPFTSMPGDGSKRASAPDVKMIAFACAEPGNRQPPHICVKAAGSETVRRLTNGDTSAFWRAWSPD